MNKNKCFLYVRKSTDTEDKQVQSLEDQINTMTKKAESYWLEIIEIFQESMSAKAPGRYRFNEMISRIQSWEVKLILAWKLDRLTRNPVDSWTIQYMLQNWSLDKIITNDREYNPLDAWLLFSVETWMSNQFILDLKKSVKRWMDSKTDKGIFCARVPEWYINNKAEKTIEIDTERFHLIRKMWEMLLSWNYTVPQIMRIANNEWWFKRRSLWKYWWKKFHLSWFYKMFNNIFYTGDFLWKWNIKKWTHLPMVSYEEFYRAQEILWKKSLNIRWHTKEFAYTWFMKCWECGSAITAEEKIRIIKSTWEAKNYIYYRCTKKKKWWETCSQKPIRLEELEKQIDSYLSAIEIIPEFKQWALDILKNDYQNDILEKEMILKNLYKSLELSERQLNKLTDSLISEIITDEDYKIRKKYLIIEINKFKEQIDKLNKENDTSWKLTEDIFDFIIRARTKFNHWNLQTKKEIVISLGLNWVLNDWKLDIEAFPWFVPIKKLSIKIIHENPRLELIKNSTCKLNTSAKNSHISVWYSNKANFEQIYFWLKRVNMSYVSTFLRFYFLDFNLWKIKLESLSKKEKELYWV